MKRRYSSGTRNKYSDFLTVLLVLVIIAILALLGFFGYKAINKHSVQVGAQNAYDRFQESVKNNIVQVPTENEIVENEIENNVENEAQDGESTDLSNLINQNTLTNPENNTNNNSSSGSDTTTKPNIKKEYYAGYEIKGSINIPKINCKYPILEKVTTKSLEAAPAILDIVAANSMDGTIKDLNIPGTNALILGHNYKNDLFFSNNHKLEIGDKIIITDQTGTVVTYTIYKKYYAPSNDADFMLRELDPNVREITLQTCNDDSSQRLIIWAKDK